jgi:hypothetical protein
MAGTKWPLVGQRIRECLRDLGYWNNDRDRPDVIRFCLDRRYLPQQVYKWIEDETFPDRENLERLGHEFGVNPAWLAWGDTYAPKTLPQPMKSPRGKRVLGVLLIGLGLSTGSMRALAPPLAGVSDPLSVLPLIRSRRFRWRPGVLALISSWTLGCP